MSSVACAADPERVSIRLWQTTTDYGWLITLPTTVYHVKTCHAAACIYPIKVVNDCIASCKLTKHFSECDNMRKLDSIHLSLRLPSPLHISYQ